MPLVCERELVPPETQGYTAAILEWILAIRQAAGLDTDVTKELSALPKVVAESEAFVRAHLHDILRAPKITVTGSGLHWATAMEGALKMRETLRHAVMREETEELSHLADLAFEDDDLLMAIVQTDRDRQTVNLVSQITDHVLEIEAGEDDFSLITAVIPFQLAGAIGAAGWVMTPRSIPMRSRTFPTARGSCSGNGPGRVPGPVPGRNRAGFAQAIPL